MFGFMDNQNQQQNNNNQQNQNQNSDNNANNDSNNQNQNSQSNNDANNDDNNDSNNNNNVDNNTSIWDNNINNDGNNDQNNNNQNQNNQQNNNQNQQTASEIFDQHVADLDLTSGIDLSKLQEEAADGNFESINKAFETVSANTYKAALQQMNTLVDNKIATAFDKAVSESSSAMNENMAIKEMHSALPFAGDKDIAPVAEAAMKQIMSQGASVSEAIEKVGQFFQSTAQKINGNSDNHQNSGFNPDGNVNNNSNNNNQNQGEESWMDFLTNKS